MFLSGIFDMIGDPTVAIRLSALAFLQSVLPKILVLNTDTPLEENRMAVDFDKILVSGYEYFILFLSYTWVACVLTIALPKLSSAITCYDHGTSRSICEEGFYVLDEQDCESTHWREHNGPESQSQR